MKSTLTRKIIRTTLLAACITTTACSSQNKAILENTTQNLSQEKTRLLGYTDSVETKFIDGCTQSFTEKAGQSETSRQAKKYCGCAFEKVSSEIDFDDFSALDKGQRPSPEAANRFNAIIEECAQNVINSENLPEQDSFNNSQASDIEQNEEKTCESLRGDIIDLSERDRASRGYAIVKIYEPREIFRSDDKLACEGQASWSDQDETKLKYSTYKDSEGEWMLEYEPIQ